MLKMLLVFSLAGLTASLATGISSLIAGLVAGLSCWSFFPAWGFSVIRFDYNGA